MGYRELLVHPHYRGGGAPSTSNIEWTYDLRPIKKWTLFILSACFIGSIGAFLLEKGQEVERKKELTAEAGEVKQRYLEKRLEAVKRETIAAEQLRIMLEERSNRKTEPVKRIESKKGPRVYTWVNDNGQTVHSNRPKE
jgi:hypothetical protein